MQPTKQASLTPLAVPTQVGLSRANIEALVKGYFMAKYKLKPGDRTFTFNWKDFEHELIVEMKR